MAERTRITREIVQRLAEGAPPDAANGDYAEQMQALAQSWLRAVAALREVGSELHALGITRLPQWPVGIIMRRVRALEGGSIGPCEQCACGGLHGVPAVTEIGGNPLCAACAKGIR